MALRLSNPGRPPCLPQARSLALAWASALASPPVLGISRTIISFPMRRRLQPGLAAGIRPFKGVKKLGVRLGNWLPPEQSQALWQAPDVECSWLCGTNASLICSIP